MFICNSSSSLAIRDLPFYICVELEKEKGEEVKRKLSLRPMPFESYSNLFALFLFLSHSLFSAFILPLKPSVRHYLVFKTWMVLPKDSNLAPQSRFVRQDQPVSG